MNDTADMPTEVLSDSRIRAELNELMLEQARFSVESMRLHVEREKWMHKRPWFPAVAIAAGAGATITGVLIKF